MGLVARLFGRSPSKGAGAAKPPRPQGLGVTETRGQLVRMAHRDTIRRHGIPEQWLGIEALSSKDARGSLGVHARLVVRNAEARLMPHLPHLLDLIRLTLARLDHSSPQWLLATSVRFDLPAGHRHQPMPPVSSWGAVQKPRQKPEPRREDKSPDSSRDWLERMFDAAPKRHDPGHDFRPTQPMYGGQDG
ncbi:hypothetical protein [Ramlibacter humi]|uniref:Uncharacterized protein n=1 Tax=Ramlibacter humi TaxID=2530451 RepID=A0A4Z0BLS3_9BURK|nr:hypothetical protein [Ramlibacter humi]TFZ00276.1 hypothetical protein EZ216_14345 [Ramlibacter humi]